MEEVSITLQPATTPAVDPDGYYIVGDFTGWDGNSAQQMKKDALDENLYILEAEIESTSNFKIFPASAINGNDIDWTKALGSSVDGDDSGDNFVSWTNAGAINTALDGKIKISFDAFNYRFTGERQHAAHRTLYDLAAHTTGELLPVIRMLGKHLFRSTERKELSGESSISLLTIR